MPDNVIGGMRHWIRCPAVVSRDSKDCACDPTDDSRAMNGADLKRLFEPLSPEDAKFLKYI